MAERLDVEWISETLHERNLLDVLDVALDHIDEPLADPSFLPTFLLSRLAARHVKVVVGGDGGDELWGGYPTYRAHRMAAVYRHVPAWIRNHVIGGVVGRLPIDDRYQSLEWKLRRFTKRWDDDMVTRHLRWMSAVDLPDLARAIPAAKGMRPATLSAPLPETDDLLQRILALDFSTYMPGSVLTKVDRASMAHGLEVRPPLLDHRLVELAGRIPDHLKCGGGVRKRLLKHLLERQLPHDLVHRRKRGFAIPTRNFVHDRGLLRPQRDLDVLGAFRIRKTAVEGVLSTSRDHNSYWLLHELDHFVSRG